MVELVMDVTDKSLEGKISFPPLYYPKYSGASDDRSATERLSDDNQDQSKKNLSARQVSEKTTSSFDREKMQEI